MAILAAAWLAFGSALPVFCEVGCESPLLLKASRVLAADKMALRSVPQ